jgi:hypothetical protein
MKWFDNPRKRRRSPSQRRKSKRRPPKGFRSWKAYMASIRPKAKGSKNMARKRRKSRSRKRTRRTRRSRASVVVLRNPRRRRVSRRRNRGMRRYRRRSNPGRSIGSISPRSVINRAIQGAKDGLFIVGGKVVTNALPTLLGLSPTGALGIGMKALSAVAAGYLFDFVSRDAGKLATASGFATIYEPFLKGFNLPIVSAALAADDYGYDSLSAYPDEVGSLSAYPSVAAPVGVGADDDDFSIASQY